VRIAIRVDASLQIGAGHFMRCLTLADALNQRGTEICFICRHLPEYLRAMLSEKGYEFIALKGTLCEGLLNELPHSHWLGVRQLLDAQETIKAISDRVWDWLVVDHYALDFHWEKELRSIAKHVLVIDDIADRIHDCDILLDQNFYFNMADRYVGRVPHHCKLLLGPRYAILRKEFHQQRQSVKPRSGIVKRVLIFFGGMDADNYTAQAIKTLVKLGIPNLHVDVIVGVQHPCLREIKLLCAMHGYFCHVQINQVASLMADADLAIGAGGSTTWERCCLGLPALVISLANNQDQLINDAAIQGVLYAPIKKIGKYLELESHIKILLDNPCLLQGISLRSFEMVDGRGISRILREMKCSSIQIRKATLSDSEEIFTWRNHVSIRSVSRNTDLIEKPRHDRWFSEILFDPNRILLVGECDGKVIGVVRFDVTNGKADVSIYLVPGCKEVGLGSEFLISAEYWIAQNHPDVFAVHAEVIGKNKKSHYLFISNGYDLISSHYFKKVDFNECSNLSG
jgi:UDP-2,4-diacetamido-2,4,6-trideoxy-beta-L-altropyranose hydrolase